MFFRLVATFTRYASIPIIAVFLRSLACDEDLVPFRLYHTTSSLGLCPRPILAKLPSILFTPDFKAVLVPTSRELPNTGVMSGQRLGKVNESIWTKIKQELTDLGKIMTVLESAGTQESTKRLEAVRGFDDQAKQTIRSIGKLNWASQLTLDTCTRILSGLIDALEQAPERPVSMRRTTSMVVPLQDQINAWIEGLLDQLRSFYQQTITTLNDLDSSDARFLHVFQISATTIDDREADLIQGTEEENEWTSTADILGIDYRQVRAPVLGKAIQDFEALVKAIMKARAIVTELSSTLSRTIREFEAASLDSSRRMAVRMDSQDQVDFLVEKLKKLKQEVEQVGIGQY